MLIPGLLFGMLAGYYYWFPKAFGFRLDDCWGKLAFFNWTIGFILAFMPLYALGLLGMPRRTVEYFNPAYFPCTVVALIGAGFILPALACLMIQLLSASVGARRTPSSSAIRGTARTLEWTTPCAGTGVQFRRHPDRPRA